MDAYFTYEKIKELVTQHGWELVKVGAMHQLRQKDNHAMTTVVFRAPDQAILDFLRD